MRETAEYVALITPFNSRPKFVATVEASVDPLVQLQELLAELPQDFDIDTAIGAQLDAVGVRVGRARKLVTPLTPFFFALDDPKRGLDRGIWFSPQDTQYGISLLDDGTYRRLLKATVLANIWDGTVAGQQTILNAFFLPGTLTFIEDRGPGVLTPNVFSLDDPSRGLDQAVWGDGQPLPTRLPPSITIGVSGKIPAISDLELLGQGLVAAKPAGIALDYTVTSVDGAPVFGLDVDNSLIGGLDHGAWGQTPDQLVATLSS